MTRSQYRILLVAGAILLTGVLATQGYWLARAYSVQEEQFDVSVNLAMRRTVHRLLLQQGDSTSNIPAVQTQADQAFAIELPHLVANNALDSTLRAEFTAAHIDARYDYSMRTVTRDSIVFGNTVSSPSSLALIDAACTTRHGSGPAALLEVRFPGKELYLAGSMTMWIATTFATLLILAFFTIALRSAFRERRYHELKNDFIQNITHELKTPISGIILATDMLKHANGSSTKYIAAIEGETARLDNHVDRLLSAASLESKGVALQLTPYHISDILTPVIEELKSQHPGRVIDLTIEADANVLLDGYHTANAIRNVTDNALRYSESGTNVSVRVYSHNDETAIEVTDAGPGIPAKYQQYIFDKFFRVPNGNVHNVKGFGLGLYYTRYIVEEHKGRVALHSREKYGTTVTIFLPLDKDAAHA